MKATANKSKDNPFSHTADFKGSGGGSGAGITYSTIANIPKAKRNKLI